MKPLLTLVVPLHNVESTLRAMVDEMLEVAAEVTPHFEVLLVDDGSTDATLDAAHELSRRYTQVQIIMHPTHLGAQSVVHSAVKFSRGEWLILSPASPEFDLHELLKLWTRRTAEGVVVGQCAAAGHLGSIPPSPTVAPAIAPYRLSDVLLVPHRLLLVGNIGGDCREIVADLRQRGFPVVKVDLRRRRRSLRTAELQTGLGARNGSTPVIRCEPAAPASAPVKRPNLLAKIRAFARGE